MFIKYPDPSFMYLVGIAHRDVMHHQVEKLKTQRRRITNHKSTNSVVLNMLPREAFHWQGNIQCKFTIMNFKNKLT